MRLICPSCGAVSSADTFVNDDLCRAALAKIAAMPGPLPQATLGYLSLFRESAKRALTWKKVLRLAAEISEIVGKNYVHVQGRPDKSCQPSLWARGMEQMVEQRNSLRLPMESHIYLEKVVWDLANAVDGKKEEVQYQHPLRVRQQQADADPELDPMEKARREWDAKHGTPQVKGIDDLAKLVGRIGNVD